MPDNINQLKNENRLLKNLISEIAVENKILNMLSNVETEVDFQPTPHKSNSANHSSNKEIASDKTAEIEQKDSFSLKNAKAVMEINLITRALEFTRGNRTHAARLLEISHPSLLSKIKEYRIKI